MKKKGSKNKLTVPAKLLDEKSPFAVRESFNQLRTNLMYISADSNTSPIYGITSVDEGSGKSTIIANLAISFAQIGKKVLIIDGDMRCPSLHRFFDVSSDHAGLSDLISGMATDAIVHTSYDGLDFISSGRIPPNPSELLLRPKVAEMFLCWKKEYDIIFIDFPPIGLLTDAVAVCNIISGYIFNVRAEKCTAKEINTCIESMEQVGAKIVGIVLNDYNTKGNDNKYQNSKYSRYSTEETKK